MNNIWIRFLIVSFSFFFNFSIFAQSPFIGLVLEEIPNSGFTNGEKTYRLYAELSSGSVFMMFGDETRPHSIVTTTTFFNQDLFGGQSNLQSQVNTGAFGFIPALQYDTWAALGNSYTSAPSTVGNVGFGSNLSGSSWTFGGSVNSDASIFRVGTDPLCIPDANGRVLLGQFTTNGVLSGFINLQGSAGGGVVWVAANIPIPQILVPVPGCTDPASFNYNSSANTDDGSCIAVVTGCTDPASFNYNSSANTDDGSCIAVVLGCTDPASFNYNSSANTDDGSCIAVVTGCTDPASFNYNSSANTDDGSCIAVVLGCTDPASFNYNSSANTDDGSCIAVVTGCTDPASFNYNSSANTDDGSCIAVVTGCTDPASFNYNSSANTDDGSCIAVVLGCTDPASFNYNSSANTDDGSCIAVVTGCTDPASFNYNSSANTDDGSCIAVVLGCTDPASFNYNSSANTDDGSCIAVVTGCTDPASFNYNSSANTDDGSCIAVVTGCTDPASFNYNSSANTNDGSCIAVVLGCTDPASFNYNSSANTDDGSCIAVVTGCTDPASFNYNSSANTDDGSCIAVVLGCTDPASFNYNSSANTDDGSCIAVVTGCTDPASFNYNSSANTDDGSCIAVVTGCTDPASFNYNSSANTNDGSCIAVVLGCTDPASFNYNSSANTDDGSCIAVVTGCTDPASFNYNSSANTDDGSCIAVVLGCTDPASFNYNSSANTDDGSCIAVVTGCTDPASFNYNSSANTDDGSCIAVVTGCTDPASFNYNSSANTNDGSCIAVVLGCTDPASFNYNSSANTDDGSCIAVVLGCTDPASFNYNSSANTDDGSCIAVVLGCTDPASFNYNSSANTDDGSCIAVVTGCTDPASFNYNSSANTDDGSCIAVVLGCTDPASFNYNSSANTNDGSCIAVVLGCTDPASFNYNSSANTDDGSCIAVVLGCTDPASFNYNSSANTDDGSCIAVVLGCTDPASFNYNSSANTDDGSCIAVVTGCTDPASFNYNSSANTDDGSCIAVVLGCTDPASFNYNSSANTDDGSCIAVVLGCTDPASFNYNSSANTDDGSCIAVVTGCTDPASFNYNSSANTDDGSCIAVVTGCTDPASFNYNSSANTDDGSCIAVVTGCTDPASFNYNSSANTDDGSCIAVVTGCTDPASFNYNSSANTDDGSCIAVVTGCTDPASFNYNSSANTDDGSCIAVVTGCTDPASFNYNSSANTDDGSCIAVVTGCTDPASFNYNSSANTDDGSCIAVVTGCTDPASFNYNSSANTNDGSCIAVVTGCTDPASFNYNSSANTDDGSCIAVVTGCTDPTACNYGSLANTDDGSCNYATTSTTTVTACVSYSWNGTTYTSSGVYDSTFTNSVGCDSIATLSLTIDLNPAQPTLACYESATFNTTTCAWVVTGTQPVEPTTLCYETAIWNGAAGICAWVVTGTQPVQPTLACYESATFNTTTCLWDVSGNQPVQPTLACYESATFNTTTCLWDVSGTQPVQPTLACYESATFNTTTCVWDVTGTQPVQPTLACYETATFNTTACVWDVSGTQPVQPTLACYETATFNTTTCVWDVSGTQPVQPTLACYESATLNTTSCTWVVTGNPPPAPAGLSCWQTATFNTTTCAWVVTGTQPAAPTGLSCWQTATFNTTTCIWDVTGSPLIVSISASPASATVCSGSSVTLQMTTYAAPTNTYQWSNANGAISGATAATYTTSVAGTYSLTVTPTNGCGATSSALVVTIINVAVPSGLFTSNIGLTSATMNWGSVSNADHYDIRWRVQGSSTWLTQNNILDTSIIKTGLTGATTYEWEVRSACSPGTSSASLWSVTQNFTTTTPCVVPTIPVTTGITTTTATLGWNVVSGAWGYSVRYKKTTQPWAQWTYVVVNTNSYALTALLSGTAYHWQVASMCDANGSNTSAYSALTAFTTFTCNIALAQSTINVACTGASTGAIDLSVSGGSGTYSYLWSNGAITQDLTSLIAGTYSVTVTDSWGCTATTSAVITTVLPAPPTLSCWETATFNTTTCVWDVIVSQNIPSGLFTSNIGLTSATMNWGSVSNADHYDIRWRVQGSSTWLTQNNILDTSIIKTGLTGATTYEWEVRSACSPGTSSSSLWSVTQNFTTATPCVVPTTPVTTGITTTTATLGWNVVSGAWGYSVRYKKTTQPWAQWTYVVVNTNSYALTALLSGTDYHWQVASMCDANGSNTSAYSALTAFTTFTCNIALAQSTINVACTGASTGAIDLSVSGGSGTYSYLWSNGAITQDLTSLIAGTYSVTVTDSWGCTATTSAVITTVLPAPPTLSCWETATFNTTTCVWDVIVSQNIPSGLFTSNIGLTSATMNWGSVSNADHYDIRWRIQGSSIWLTQNNISDTSIIKTNLIGATTYEWEVRSACSPGTSSASLWSVTQNFTTATPCVVPTTPVTTGITTTTATLGWNVVSGAWGYSVRYKKTTQPWAQWTYVVVNTNSYALTALLSGTDYHWQVASMCDANGSNTSAYSALTAFTTFTCNIALAQSTINVACTGASTGAIDLSVSGGSGTYSYLWSNGAITQDLTSLIAGTYSVTVTDSWGCTATTSAVITTVLPAPPTLSCWETTIFNTTTCAWDNTGTQPVQPSVVDCWDTFVFNATTCAWDNTGTQPAPPTLSCWETTIFNTTTCVWDVIVSQNIPSGLFTSNIGLTSATMNWGSVSNADHYDIRWRIQGSSIWLTQNNILDTSIIKTGLTGATTYEWEVRSACSPGTSSASLWSVTQNFTTTTPCVVPTIPVTTGITTTTATLGWNVVSGAWGYSVRYKKTTQPWAQWTYVVVNTNSYALTALLSGTAYHWQVASMCDANGSNTSAYSALTAFTTFTCNIALAQSTINVACTGASTGAIDLSVSGGSGTYSYLWSNGAITQDLTSLIAGTYSVTVTDSWGCTATTSAVITTVLPAPPTLSCWETATFNTTTCVWDVIVSQNIPSGLFTSNIGLTSATMNWGSVSNADHYDIRWRVQGSSTWLTQNNILDTSIIKTGLTGATTYEWEVRSACSPGTSSSSLWSVTQNFTTATPCVVPTTPVTTGITTTTATLGWNVVSGAWGYSVRYKKTTQPWAQWTYVVVNTNSYALTALLSGTAYHWSVASMCDANGSNNSDYTGFTVFTTFVDCTPPSGLFTSNIGLTSVTINWGSVSNADNYDIRMRVQGSSTWTIDINNIPGADISRTKLNLTGATTYEWEIRSACSPGNSTVSAWSSTQTFTTLSPCTTPVSPVTTLITQTSATLGWDAVSGAWGYKVRYKKISQSFNQWTYVVVNTNSYALTALLSGTAYHWQVASMCDPNGSNTSAYTGYITFNTAIIIVNGCTDSNATNYNASANTDDGSCTYPSPFIGLVLEEVNNTSAAATFVNGEKTYRLYAELSSGTLNQMFGDVTRPHSIVTTTTFFNQDLFGLQSNLQSQVVTGAFGFIPALEYDTWAALGDSYSSAPSTVGDVGFGSNLSGSSWTFGGSVNSDASIFRVGTDPLCIPDANGRVLLGQFTTNGVLSGFINLAGQNTDLTPWTENQIPIPQLGSRITEADVSSGINLNIYPNPTRGVFNISFVSEEIDNFEINIIDAFGKLVSTEEKQDFVGEYTKAVDLSNWPRGIYMIQIKTKDSFVNKRIVLQ